MNRDQAIKAITDHMDQPGGWEKPFAGPRMAVSELEDLLWDLEASVKSHEYRKSRDEAAVRLAAATVRFLMEYGQQQEGGAE